MLADDEGLQKKLGISDVAEEHPCLLEEDDTGLIESLAFLLLEGDNLAFFNVGPTQRRDGGEASGGNTSENLVLSNRCRFGKRSCSENAAVR